MELQKLVAGIQPDNDQKVSVKLQKNLKMRPILRRL